jgi:hypothetical protein
VRVRAGTAGKDTAVVNAGSVLLYPVEMIASDSITSCRFIAALRKQVFGLWRRAVGQLFPDVSKELTIFVFGVMSEFTD